MAFAPPPTYVSKAGSGYLGTFSTGSPLVPVVEIVSFTAPIVANSPIKKTHLQSPNYTHELYQGMNNPGVFDVTGNFIGDPTQTGILTAMQNGGSGAELNFQILASMQAGAKTLTVAGLGYFSELELGPFENDKNIDFKAKFQTSGASTVTVA
jgi:hypothetical protein